MPDFLVFLSLVVVAYVYYGYGRLLSYLSARVAVSELVTSEINEDDYPALTVLVTVFNESHVVQDRIDNILSCSYPVDKLKVVIASDGSDDGTDDIVASYQDERVILFRASGREGKTATQNQAIQKLDGDIIVFSDAGTIFDEKFLREIVLPFNDDTVGAVDGHLTFGSKGESGLAASQGYYWNYELKIRQHESSLGILAVASGACLAVRRKLFVTMDPTVGEDCIVPLDVASQGYRVVHAASAHAFDEMDKAGGDEFRARVRMTLRNWQGTWSRANLLNPLSFPGFAFSLWSHKIFRWLSPFFLIAVMLISISLAFSGSFFYQMFTLLIMVFLVFALFGWQCEKRRITCRIPSIAYSFVLANAGFFLGVIKAFLGGKISSYR